MGLPGLHKHSSHLITPKWLLWAFLTCMLNNGLLFGQGIPQDLDTSGFSSDSLSLGSLPIRTIYFKEDSLLLGYYQYAYPDSSLNDFHVVDAFDQFGEHWVGTGSVVSPGLSLTFSPFDNIGYFHGVRAMDHHRIKYEDLRWYDTYRPYTKLKYMQGSVDDEMIMFNAVHSQNIGPRLNFSVEHRSRNALGEYPESELSAGNTSFQSRYFSQNRHYRAFFSAVWNRFQLKDNGGFQSRDNFINNTDRATLLTNRTDLRNDWFDFEVNLSQYFYFGSYKKILVDSVEQKQLEPRLFLRHSIRYSEQRSHITDLDSSGPNNPSGFYPNQFRPSNFISETFKSFEVSNKLGLGWYYGLRQPEDSTQALVPDGDGLYAGIELRNSRPSFMRLSDEFSFFSLFGEFSLQKLVAGRFALNADANAVLVGDYLGDTDVKGSLSWKIANGFGLGALTRFQSRSPYFTHSRYYSAYLRYNRDFKQINSLEAGGYIAYKNKAQLGLSYITTGNWVYLDSTLESQQLSATLNYIRLSLTSKLRWRSFNFWHSLAWQTTNQSNGPVRVPAFVADLGYFFQRGIFADAAALRLGVDVHFFSRYTGYGFFPALSHFYVQDDQEVGGFLVVDGYVSIQIKRFSLFLKMEHLNQGIGGHDYFTLANYPMYPRLFRWGLSWQFFD